MKKRSLFELPGDRRKLIESRLQIVDNQKPLLKFTPPPRCLYTCPLRHLRSWLRPLPPGLRSLACLFDGTAEHPKAHVVVAARRRVLAPLRRPTEVGIEVPAAAAGHLGG